MTFKDQGLAPGPGHSVDGLYFPPPRLPPPSALSWPLSSLERLLVLPIAATGNNELGFLSSAWKVHLKWLRP